jgi:hypothetical protein
MGDLVMGDVNSVDSMDEVDTESAETAIQISCFSLGPSVLSVTENHVLPMG